MENEFAEVCVINMTEPGNERENTAYQSYNGDKTLIRQQKLSGKAVEALNVLESWLDAVDVDVLDPISPDAHLSVRTVTGSVMDIAIVDFLTEEVATDALVVSAKALTSSKQSVVLDAFHKVTEAAGFGKPVPISRGEELEGRAKVFELIAMRHKEFRMTPNEAIELLKPYEKVLNRIVGNIYRANQKLFALHQYDADDLKTYAQIYAMSWIHRYKSRVDSENVKLLTDRVQKRLVEFIGVLRRQGRNVFHDSETSNVGMYGSVFDREEESLLRPDDYQGSVEEARDTGTEVSAVIDRKLSEMGAEKAISFLTDFAKTTEDKDVRRVAKQKLRELKTSLKEQKRLLRLKK